MSTFLLMLCKTALALALFYLFFKEFLAKDKLFIRNRFYLIGVSVISFVLPWITIPLIKSPETNTTLTFSYLAGENPNAPQPTEHSISTLPWLEIIFYIYLLGVLVFSIKTILAYFQVFRIIKNAFHLPLGKQKMAITRKKVSPFSFMNWLVISEETQQHPSFEKMVQHELVHSRQYHSVDLLIAEILIILQWFNPFTWLIRKSIMENLEFIVDNEILAVGTDAREYQYSLLHFSTAGLRPAIANNFSTNLLKKRITMMNTSKYNGKHRLHNFLIPVVLIAAMILTASFRKDVKTDITDVRKGKFVIPANSIKKKSGNKPEITISSPKKNNRSNPDLTDDSKATESFLGFIMTHITYPKEAIDVNLESIVYIPVRFKSEGAEINTDQYSEGETLKQVVVVGYKNPENLNLPPADKNSKEVKYLQEEIARVVNSYHSVPKELIGKTYILQVKFILEGQNKTLRGSSENGIQFRSKDENSNPTVILNDEKIISIEEMKNINPETIQSIDIRKTGSYKECEKLGEIKGSVIIITLKKK